MGESRKFSSRKDSQSQGQSVFKQNLFLLNVPSGSADRTLSVDPEGRIISTLNQTFSTSSTMDGPSGFSTNNVPDDTNLQAAGWIVINISGTDYYIPAWTLE